MDHAMDSAAAALLRARYGEADAPGGIALNAVIATLLAHRSVRHFLPDPLPAGTLETLVAAAQSAATSSNLQSWSVIAVEAAETRARLAAWSGGSGDFVARAPLFLCWLADLSRLERVAESHGRVLEANAYLEAFMVALVDAALAAQNAAVAAESLGLGVVYVGALRNRPQAVAEELGLPPGCVAAFGMAIGHPDPDRPAEVKPRLPQSVVLHRERYGSAAEGEAVARYDETLARFSRAQGMAADHWTGRVLDRLGTTAALRGRERMRAILNSLGFGLR